MTDHDIVRDELRYRSRLLDMSEQMMTIQAGDPRRELLHRDKLDLIAKRESFLRGKPVTVADLERELIGKREATPEEIRRDLPPEAAARLEVR